TVLDGEERYRCGVEPVAGRIARVLVIRRVVRCHDLDAEGRGPLGQQIEEYDVPRTTHFAEPILPAAATVHSYPCPEHALEPRTGQVRGAQGMVPREAVLDRMRAAKAGHEAAGVAEP